MSRYTDAHRFIAQKFMTCGPAYRKDVARFIEEAGTATKVQLGTGDNDLVEIFKAINAKLAPMNIKIQRVPNELNGTSCYVLINMNTREVVDWKTDYTDKELELISKIFSAIANSDDRELGIDDVYKIGSKTTSECDRIVRELRDTAYLATIPHSESDDEDESEKLGFGVRAVGELYDYMARNYSDVLPECGACKRLVFNKGETIQCQKCQSQSVFHTACKKKNTATAAASQATQRAGVGLSCTACKAPLVLA